MTLYAWKKHCKNQDSNGNIFLIHGYRWHSGYFLPLADHLNKIGYDVYSFDLPGHGKSESLYGIRGYIESLNDWTDSSEEYINFILSTKASADENKKSNCQTPKPLFVLGESIGGTVAFSLALRPNMASKISGLILSAPALKLSENVRPPSIVIYIVLFLSQFFPFWKMPAQELDDAFDSSFGNKSYAEYARNDKLVSFDSPRFLTAAAMLKGFEDVSSSYNQLNVPFLVLHGLNDTKTDWQNSVNLYDTAKTSNKAIKLYENMMHQLFQDTNDNVKIVTNDVSDWIKEQEKTYSSKHVCMNK